jgi:hypothetical protein
MYGTTDIKFVAATVPDNIELKIPVVWSLWLRTWYSVAHVSDDAGAFIIEVFTYSDDGCS